MKGDKQKMNGWKVTAIIFIILFMLETLCFGYFMYIGVTAYNKEIKCSDKCYSDGARSYYQGGNSDLCTCYYEDEHYEYYNLSEI